MPEAATTPPPLPLPRAERIDPPAPVVKALAELRSECTLWRPVEVKPGDRVSAAARATPEAQICGQLAGDHDPAAVAQIFGAAEGLVLAVAAIAGYKAMDGVVRGVARMASRRFARGGCAPAGSQGGGAHGD